MNNLAHAGPAADDIAMIRPVRFSMLTLLLALINAGLFFHFVFKSNDVSNYERYGSLFLLLVAMSLSIYFVEKSVDANEKLGPKYPRWRHVLTYALFSLFFVFPICRTLTYENHVYEPGKTYVYEVQRRRGGTFTESSNGRRLNRIAETEIHVYGYALISVWLGFTAYSVDLILRAKGKKTSLQ